MQTRAADDGGDDMRACAGADLIVLAAPVQTNIRILQDLPKHVTGNVQVTDVGSTKRQIAETARRLPDRRLQFIGGHPLSGAATGGLQAARTDLFAGRSWILTPVGEGGLAMARLSRFIDGLGRGARDDPGSARCRHGLRQPSAAAHGKRADARGG